MYGTIPLGLALSGAIMQRAGPRVLVLLVFVGMIVLAGAATLSRSLRDAPKV